ncbi:unnamed protein product [Cylindrotheca closterium]|uniref:Uncharacterized protein n=1 Tax=Cylindrotheca closterium TaxID=2856 RepID=A0AAD2FIT3_9STRA|nr:unnamed protein product [Cylindrotheca closterium]
MESACSYNGMDTSIRKLSIDDTSGGIISPSCAGESSKGTEPKQWHIMTNLSTSLVQALDADTSAHPVTPCPSDSSCCTDCGVSSSMSHAAAGSPLSWDHQSPVNNKIPTEVQMAQQQQQQQQSKENAQKPSVPAVVNQQQQQQSAASNAAVSKNVTSEAQKRRHFLILVQIIFKVLKQAKAQDAITFHCKKVIRECTQRNRQGDPNFTSLVDSATPRLRKVVGEKTWRRSILLLKHYIQQQQQQQQPAMVV